MIKKKILIIEDEEITAMALEAYLESLGYIITDCVNNANDAMQSVKTEKPDLIISDIIIQGSVSGCEVSRDIHIKYNIPIIFLTAHIDDEMLDYAADAKAYGYILKPYRELELKATLRLALNHYSPNQDKSENIFFGEYNLINNMVFKDKEEIKLGKKSLMLVELLAKNSNRVLTYEELLDVVYKEGEKNIDNLRHLVKRTKEKLDKDVIISIKNIGYKVV